MTLTLEKASIIVDQAQVIEISYTVIRTIINLCSSICKVGNSQSAIGSVHPTSTIERTFGILVSEEP